MLAAAGNLAGLLLLVLFMLITLFFVYKDGAHIAGQLNRVGEHLLPERWQRFSRVVPATVSATVTGMGLIAIGEGVVLGVAYWIAGVPSPVLKRKWVRTCTGAVCTVASVRRSSAPSTVVV